MVKPVVIHEPVGDFFDQVGERNGGADIEFLHQGGCNRLLMFSLILEQIWRSCVLPSSGIRNIKDIFQFRVITGGIKANFPARIAFRVMQMTDSRTIIDQPGANQLIGRGDMLLSNGGELTRIQCAFVDTPEVESIVEHIGRQQGYTSAYNLPDYTPEAGSEQPSSFGSEESGAPQKYDPKFAEIAREAVSSGVISTSMIQRNFEVGFNRAGRIMLQLERAGIVGPQIGSKAREIKFYDLPSLEAKLQDMGLS